jgi:hypothetical protein
MQADWGEHERTVPENASELRSSNPSRPTLLRLKISHWERSILVSAMAEVTAAEGHDVPVQALSKHDQNGAPFAAYADEMTGNKD